MCNRCDYDSQDNQVYYDDGFVHQKEYIAYCPWCGRKLGE